MKIVNYLSINLTHIIFHGCREIPKLCEKSLPSLTADRLCPLLDTVVETGGLLLFIMIAHHTFSQGCSAQASLSFSFASTGSVTKHALILCVIVSWIL